jgi:putative PIN family toxin of toxin-antitoxin system
MRLVLDTCMILSAIKSRNGASFLVVRAALAGEFTPVVSLALLAEYADVLFLPSNRVDGWSDQDLHTFVADLSSASDWAEPHFRYRPTLNDEGDELVLEAAINGRAHIATYNQKDFPPRSLAPYDIRVYRPRDVLSLLKERRIGHGTS